MGRSRKPAQFPERRTRRSAQHTGTAGAEDFALEIAWSNHRSGRLEEAEAGYRSVLAGRADHPLALRRLGLLLMQTDRDEEAIETLRRCVARHPRHADAHMNLGSALQAAGRVGEAMRSFRHAARLAPDSPAVYNNLAIACRIQADYPSAIRYFRKCLDLDPQNAAAHSDLLCCLNLDPGTDDDTLFAEHLAWDARHGRPRCRARSWDDRDRDPARPIRVGYVSPDFRSHPVGHFLAGVLPGHDPAAVEIHCYSDVVREDGLTRMLRAATHRWRPIAGRPDSEVADLIAADRIDILVDLAGHTAGNRLTLFAMRPAPIQVSWLGYFNTTGLRAMDYLLTDETTVPPGNERFFTETIVRLPETRFCYQPPPYAPPVSPPPMLKNGQVTFGSFNNLSKVTPAVVDVWSAVLAAVPESRLVLKWRTLADRETRDRYLRKFKERGIAADRIDLRPASPHREMLAEYGAIDVALDPFPFSGGVTSCEALWMGVPVVSVPGARPVSRQTASFLSVLDLEDLIAIDGNNYVALSASLANEPNRLTTLRTGLRDRMRRTCLGKEAAFVGNLEAAYRKMWQRWCHSASASAL